MDGFTPEGQAANERLDAYYNDGVQTAANPGGYDGDGHLTNFIPTLRDVSLVAREIVRIAYSTLAEMERLAGEQQIAALLIEGGPVSSFNGQTGAITFELPRVLAPGNQSPTPGSTATLSGGALTLAVVGFNSLYGGTQKSRRAQISTSPDFASIAWDSGNVAGAQLFVTLANAQSVLTGGTTYHWRFQQTDNEQSYTSAWSAPTSFVFPRAPSAPTMTTPANGATGQGAQNNPIAFAASDYAHPNNVARASRVFEISTTSTFASIVASVPAANGSSTASLPTPKNVLQPDTLYYVRCRDTDANGGTNTSAATTFRTVAAFRPNIGDAYQGGTYAGQSGGKDVILADKATRTFDQYNQAQNQAAALVSNGYDDWVIGTRVVYQVVSQNLRGLAAFVSGAQSFENVRYWTSDINGTSEGPYPYTIRLSDGDTTFDNPANNNYMRAVRLVTP